jgi:hypothetical protein
MDFLFGADMPLWVRFAFAFVVVFLLMGGTIFLLRRFGGERLGASSARGRQPRLAVIDAAAVDSRRRLILIRRDNVEHLLMIGGPTDVVVEANIVRAATAARDAAGPRPPADALPRAAAMNEGNMWPLQPEPAPAATPMQRPRQQPAMDEPPQWNADPEPPAPLIPPRRQEARPEARMELRPEPRVDMRAEPRSEMRAETRSDMRAEPRSDMRPEPRPEPRTADPLAGLAAELARVQAEPAPPIPKPRPPREREAPRARAPQPERPVERLRPVPPADEPAAADADQNLAEMAQRLEAALRRPKQAAGDQPRAPEFAPRPALMTAPAAPEPMMEPDPIPMMAEPAETHAHDAPPAASQPIPMRAPPVKPAAQKSVYDSLEQEMASLLGRPNSKA